jgi:hypothetical protein
MKTQGKEYTHQQPPKLIFSNLILRVSDAVIVSEGLDFTTERC